MDQFAINIRIYGQTADIGFNKADVTAEDALAAFDSVTARARATLAAAVGDIETAE